MQVMTHEPLGRLWSSDAWLIDVMTSTERERFKLFAQVNHHGCMWGILHEQKFFNPLMRFISV